MGCFHSKLAARSRSFRGDFSLSLQGRTNGVPALEDLLSSKNGGDQFLALLCTANTVAMKLRSHEHEKPAGPWEEPESPEDQSSEPEVHETINAWELMADLEDEEDDDTHEGDVHDDKQQELKQPEQEQDQQKAEGGPRIIVFESTGLQTSDESKLDLEDKSLTPIKEFHVGKCHVSEETGLHSEDELVFYHHREQEAVPRTAEASSSTDSDAPKVRDIDCSAQSTASSGSEFQSNEQSVSTKHERGFRRKAMAKDLRPLKVPNFEFSSTRGLYRYGEGEEVSSPGSYVTPRFGNYLKYSESHGRADGGNAFDVELAAHLEEAMKRLSMEDEHILRQIVEDFLEHIQDSE